MMPGHPVEVPADPAGENNNGEMFAVVVARVTENPVPGVTKLTKPSMKGGSEQMVTVKAMVRGSTGLLLSRAKLLVRRY